MNGLASEDSSRDPSSDDDQRVYFVPHRWWKEAQDSAMPDSDGKKGVLYTASPVSSSYMGPMKIINNIFNSDLVFNLRRADDSGQNNGSGEVGVSGRDYALVPGEMWLQALKWHSGSKVAAKEGRSFSAAEDDIADVYPLQLRLSVMRETNSLGVKISKRDNAAELFKRACKIFTVESDLLRIWDFSGQTTLYFSNDKAKFQNQEVLLELQIYGLSDSLKCKDGKKDETVLHHPNFVGCGTSFIMNGCSGNMNSNFPRTNSTTFSGSCGEAGSLGLTGLQNLGNTCFMNSALQCLVHTPKLVDYFLGDYAREINKENPLGMEGELALAFGDLLRKLWAPGATPVAPRLFKSKLARFAPQFGGFNQHDSQELLAFLLDGLHEDLNRVRCKPYTEVKDGEGRPDEEVADEYWQNHLARNDSIIVDVCQGQYRSTLVCPICRKVSVTFDPFMYLSLPLPSTMIRTMTLTVVSADGSAQPTSFTITVPMHGKCEDLVEALGSACSLGSDERLLVAEIYNSCIIRYLEEPTDSLSLIRDDDQLVAYRLPKDVEDINRIVFVHQRMEEQYVYGKLSSSWKRFGIPLVARQQAYSNGSDIRDLYLKLLNPFRRHTSNAVDDTDNHERSTPEEDAECKNPVLVEGKSSDGWGINLPLDAEIEMHVTDEKGLVKKSRIVTNEPLEMDDRAKQLYVLVCWPETQIEKYDMQLLGSSPEISKSRSLIQRPQESVSLYKCLEAFLKEEPLGPEDMWYCPGCKQHRQASKKLDLWRLPEILVIHLKRFSYSRFTKNKLETYVEFPVDNLDLSAYIAQKEDQSPNSYMLYAVSNHFGSMGSGHYTAFVHHGGDRWYDFDDSRVYPVSMEKLKSSAAYVLFYRRVADV